MAIPQTQATDTALHSITNTDPAPSPIPVSFHPSTAAIHADDQLNNTCDVAPALHLSTTFRYSSDPDALVPVADQPSDTIPDTHIYSRETAPTSTRLETILTSVLNGPSVVYSSGLAALHAFYIYYNPRSVSIGDGYHGSHAVLAIHTRLTGLKVVGLDCPAEDLGPGDVIHLETPVNPTGEAFDIAQYAQKAKARGAILLVDSTFGPPGLQDPFVWGADVVMHSGTKYIGGHSDLLCGVLACRKDDDAKGLRRDRTALGSVLGSMEAWLGVRSLRTLDLRVKRQSESASKLVAWLAELIGSGRETEGVGQVLSQVKHASLQANGDDHRWLQKQMPDGYGPVFAIVMHEESFARKLPGLCRLFHHATSLGGVESLIEWRAMSDATVDRRLVRISVGIEDWTDLKQDLEIAFRALTSASHTLNP